ncbi:MAG TPA: NADH-quinone oxidoreductase subunit A [Chloroflexota bacterium]|nr:NADH-quinone oxidoreductase subunit A [Chloroflexota bacterium]
MLESYAPLAIFFAIAVVFPAIPIVLAKLLAPRKAMPYKYDVYECGAESMGPANIQFKVQFYLFALIFVIFDVEAVFLIPWAVAYKQVGLLALVEMVIFVAFLLVALAYAWRKRALEWR